MAEQRKTKFWILGGVAVVLIAAIGIGANAGKTKIGSPSDSLAQSAGAPVSNATQAPGAAATTAPKELIPIKTATRKTCTLAPLLVADKQGFFEAEGLKLVFTGELQSGQLLPSILNGNNDFGDTHPNSLALQVAGGAEVKGVARSIIEPGSSIDPKFRHMRWYVKPDLGIKSWKELIDYKKGQKLTTNGTDPSCSTFLANEIADKAGVGRDRLQYVNMETDLAGIQAVKQGNLDIVGIHPTFYKSAEDAGLQLIGDSSDAGLGEAAGLYLYYFSNDFIKKNPDTVSRFVKAITKAQNWANQHPDETAKWTSEYIGVPVEGNHYYSATTEIPEAQVKPWLDDLEKYGKIEKGKVKITDIITHEFERK